MSLTEGINNAYSLTAQINKLRAMQESGNYDPKAVEYALQQNFSAMLDGLITASDDKDDDNNSIDPFSFMIESNNQAIALQRQQQDPSNVGQTSSTSYLDSLKQFENDPTALQNFLNTNDPSQNLF